MNKRYACPFCGAVWNATKAAPRKRPHRLARLVERRGFYAHHRPCVCVVPLPVRYRQPHVRRPEIVDRGFLVPDSRSTDQDVKCRSYR